MAHIDPSQLEALGFSDEIGKRKAQATVIIAGLEGTGKTDWSLTGPKPLLYMGTDFGDEGVIQKAKGQIFRRKEGDYKLTIPHELRPFVDQKEKADDRKVREGLLANFVHDEFYKPFYKDFHNAIKAGIRSVVWDNALDIWEYTRLSVYGRNATNRSDLQAEANSKYIEMIREANVANVNLIMINHLKYAWEMYYDKDNNAKWRKTKDFEMQGFDKAPFLVTANFWTKFTPGNPDAEEPDSGTFELIVKKMRDDPKWVGQTLPALPFPELMSLLIPDVEDWG
jgi:hypothetical protein